MTTPIVKTYAYHKPSPEGVGKIATIRQAFSDLHLLLEATAPKSRELSVALTNLEQSAMWATKAVVCNDPGSQVEQPSLDGVMGDVKRQCETRIRQGEDVMRLLRTPEEGCPGPVRG